MAFGYNNSYFSLKLNNASYEYLQNGNNIAYFDEDAKNTQDLLDKKH